MTYPPCGLVVKTFGSWNSGSVFEAGRWHVVWPALICQASWQLAIEGHTRPGRTVSPSTCGTLNFQSKFTGDPGAGVCGRVVGPWRHYVTNSASRAPGPVATHSTIRTRCIQTESEHRRREAWVEQSMKIRLRSCGYVSGYVGYLELSRKPRHVAQQMRYQNVGLSKGHCLGTIIIFCWSHVTDSAHAKYISGYTPIPTTGLIWLKLAVWDLLLCLGCSASVWFMPCMHLLVKKKLLNMALGVVQMYQYDAMFGDEQASAKEINLFLMRLQGQGSVVSETTKLEMHVRMCSHSTSDFCKPYHYWVSSPASNFSTIGQSVLQIRRWGVHVRTCRGTQLMTCVKHLGNDFKPTHQIWS